MKKETIEEAAIEYSIDTQGYERESYIEAFIAGANYQAERMYSEEDIAIAFNEGMAYATMGKYIKGDEWVNTHKKEWFEQFKKHE